MLVFVEVFDILEVHLVAIAFVKDVELDYKVLDEKHNQS